MRAREQDRPDIVVERETFKKEMQDIDRSRLVFLDETGITTQMTRLHARAAAGARACGPVPCGHWHRLTLLGALSLDGMIAAMTIEAATSAVVFLAYVQQVLIPALLRLKPHAVIVMDNLSAHRAATVIKALTKAGFEIRFLPRYSPDLSPIEPCWSKVKAFFRAKGARSVEHLNQEAGPALDTITPNDARGCFIHCGYAL